VGSEDVFATELNELTPQSNPPVALAVTISTAQLINCAAAVYSTNVGLILDPQKNKKKD
jgi:hypothetical protein